MFYSLSKFTLDFSWGTAITPAYARGLWRAQSTNLYGDPESGGKAFSPVQGQSPWSRC